MIIDIISRLIDENKIYWSIEIEKPVEERIRITRSSANGQFMILIFTDSFDRIEALRQKALQELKINDSKRTIYTKKSPANVRDLDRGEQLKIDYD